MGMPCHTHPISGLLVFDWEEVTKWLELRLARNAAPPAVHRKAPIPKCTA